MLRWKTVCNHMLALGWAREILKFETYSIMSGHGVYRNRLLQGNRHTNMAYTSTMDADAGGSFA